MLDNRYLEIGVFTIAAACAAWLFEETIRGDETHGWLQWQHGPPVYRSANPKSFAAGLMMCRVASVLLAIASIIGAILFLAT